MLKPRGSVSASTLDRRVTLYEAKETRSDTGDVATTWTDVGTVYAKVDFPTTGNREEYLADAQTSVTRANITVRTLCGVAATAKLKVRYNGLDWDVVSVGENGRRFLVLACERRGDTA